MLKRFLTHQKKIRIGTAIVLVLILLMLFFRKPTSSDKVDTKIVEKIPFYIETIRLGSETGTGVMLEKHGKIVGSSDISVSAQVAGRVQSLPVSLGDHVAKDALIVKLTDTYGTYGFASQRAGLSVDNALQTYQQQVENIEKQIQDAQIAYERSQLQSALSVEDAVKQLEKAQYDLSNVSDTPGSATDLQVSKLEKDLEKAEFDYQTRLVSDTQSLDNFVATAKNIHNDVVLLMQDVIYETDKILGITNENRSLNDAYEGSLSAMNTSYLFTAQSNFYQLTNQKDLLDTKDANTITIETIESRLIEYSTFLQSVNTMLDMMEKVLVHTPGGGNLSQTELDLLKAQFDGYQAKAQATISSITTQINSINSFLATYQQQQTSLAKSVDLLRDQIAVTKKSLADAQFATQIGYDRTQIGTDNATENAGLAVESAENTLSYLVDTKSSTLKTLENSRKQAEVAYAEAVNNITKFSIKTPIDGTVTDIFVDIGQDVSPGTPLMRVVSDQYEIEITLFAHELSLVTLGQTVSVIGEEGIVASGYIVALSDAGDAQGNFKAIIQLATNTLEVGTFADVFIPLDRQVVGVDINAIRIVDNGVGEIFLRDGSVIKKQTVKLGKLLGQRIEIDTPISAGDQIVLTDLEAYDPKTMSIELKK